MSQSFLVVGLGTFGRRVAQALFEEGVYVLAVDCEHEQVNAAREDSSKAVCCDATDVEAMRAVGAFEVDTAIVALRNHFDANVLVTHALRKNGVQPILAQVNSELQAEALLGLGATEVIFPPRDMALRIAKRLIHPDLAESIPLGHGVVMIDIPCPPPFIGRTISAVALRTHYGVSLIGIRARRGEDHDKEDLLLNPAPDTSLCGEDNLILLGTLEQLTRVKGLSNGHEGGGTWTPRP